MSTLDDKYEEFAHRIDCALDAITGNDTDIEDDIYQLTHKAIKAVMKDRSLRMSAWSFRRETFTAIELADVLAEIELAEDD
jgi:hypothetical protein